MRKAYLVLHGVLGIRYVNCVKREGPGRFAASSSYNDKPAILPMRVALELYAERRRRFPQGKYELVPV